MWQFAAQPFDRKITAKDFRLLRDGLRDLLRWGSDDKVLRAKAGCLKAMQQAKWNNEKNRVLRVRVRLLPAIVRAASRRLAAIALCNW